MTNDFLFVTENKVTHWEPCAISWFFWPWQWQSEGKGSKLLNWPQTVPWQGSLGMTTHVYMQLAGLALAPGILSTPTHTCNWFQWSKKLVSVWLSIDGCITPGNVQSMPFASGRKGQVLIPWAMPRIWHWWLPILTSIFQRRLEINLFLRCSDLYAHLLILLKFLLISPTYKAPATFAVASSWIIGFELACFVFLYLKLH